MRSELGASDTERALRVLRRLVLRTSSLDDDSGLDDEVAGVVHFDSESVEVPRGRSCLILPMDVVLGAVAWALEALRGNTARHPATEMDTPLPQGHHTDAVDLSTGDHERGIFERGPLDRKSVV